MIEDFPSNSHRPVEPTDNKEQQPVEKRLESVVTGKVIRRKKPLGRRLMDTFFNGDSGVVNYLFKEVLIPALQDLATTMVKEGIEKAVYGEVRSPRRTMRGSSSTSRPTAHVSYNQPSSIIRRNTPTHRSSIQRTQYDLDVIIVENQVTAEAIVDKMYESVQEYGVVTLSDLKTLIGEKSSYTDHKYGWDENSLSGLDFKRTSEGYMLIIPEPSPIRN